MCLDQAGSVGLDSGSVQPAVAVAAVPADEVLQRLAVDSLAARRIDAVDDQAQDGLKDGVAASGGLGNSRRSQGGGGHDVLQCTLR